MNLIHCSYYDGRVYISLDSYVPIWEGSAVVGHFCTTRTSEDIDCVMFCGEKNENS